MTETARAAKVLVYSPDLSEHRVSFVSNAFAVHDWQTFDATLIARGGRPVTFPL